MVDLLSKSDKIKIANKRCYVNQIKNKSGEFSEERLAYGTSYSPLLSLRLFLEGKMKRNQLYTDKGWLENKYSSEGLTCLAISKLLNCHHRTIHQWLINHKIKRKNRRLGKNA